MINSIEGIPPLVVTSVNATQLDVEEENQAKAGRSLQQTGSEEEQDAGKVARVRDVRNSEEESDATKSASTPDFSEISDRLQQMVNDDLTVQFSIDDITKRIVLKIINAKTQELVRQIPEEESLRIAQFITNRFEQGSVTDAKV